MLKKELELEKRFEEVSSKLTELDSIEYSEEDSNYDAKGKTAMMSSFLITAHMILEDLMGYCENPIVEQLSKRLTIESTLFTLEKIADRIIRSPVDSSIMDLAWQTLDESLPDPQVMDRKYWALPNEEFNDMPHFLISRASTLQPFLIALFSNNIGYVLTEKEWDTLTKDWSILNYFLFDISRKRTVINGYENFFKDSTDPKVRFLYVISVASFFDLVTRLLTNKEYEKDDFDNVNISQNARFKEISKRLNDFLKAYIDDTFNNDNFMDSEKARVVFEIYGNIKITANKRYNVHSTYVFMLVNNWINKIETLLTDLMVPGRLEESSLFENIMECQEANHFKKYNEIVKVVKESVNNQSITEIDLIKVNVYLEILHGKLQRDGFRTLFSRDIVLDLINEHTELKFKEFLKSTLTEDQIEALPDTMKSRKTDFKTESRYDLVDKTIMYLDLEEIGGLKKKE